MIELFYSPTPNGRKISIMLEEINCPYKVTPVDIFRGEKSVLNYLLQPVKKVANEAFRER